MGGGYFNLASLGALIIWTYKGGRVPYKEIRYESNYPCFELGLSSIALVVILISVFDYLITL